MTGQTPQSMAKAAWRLAAAQHWVVARRQLLALGFTRHAINERIVDGRLHRIHRGVYAVGRPQLTRLGHFMAAVLASGDGAVLSHASAAELWKLGPREAGDIEVSLVGRSVERPGLRTHRRRSFRATQRDRVPVTTPIQTVVDIPPV